MSSSTVSKRPVVKSSTVLVALGQAFFSLSIGIGTMVTYASYFKPDTNLRHTALNVTILDTLVAILAGVVIFPAVFSVGIEPSSGPSLVFITLPGIFNSMPLSMVWSSVFFLLLVHLAADFHVQLRFQVGNVDFRIQERRNAAQAGFDVSRFQELLADDQAQGQLGCSEVSQDARFVDVLGIFAGFFAVAEIAHPVQEPLEDDPAQGFFFDFVAADFSHFDGSPFEVIGFLGKALHADAGNAVDQDADQAARHAQELFDLDQAADGSVHIAGSHGAHQVKAHINHLYVRCICANRFHHTFYKGLT